MEVEGSLYIEKESCDWEKILKLFDQEEGVSSEEEFTQVLKTLTPDIEEKKISSLLRWGLSEIQTTANKEDGADKQHFSLYYFGGSDYELMCNHIFKFIIDSSPNICGYGSILCDGMFGININLKNGQLTVQQVSEDDDEDWDE